MTTRRDFLRSLTISAAGLLVAPDALELLAEPRRELFPGFGDGSLPHRLSDNGEWYVVPADVQEAWRIAQRKLIEGFRIIAPEYPLLLAGDDGFGVVISKTSQHIRTSQTGEP